MAGEGVPVGGRSNTTMKQAGSGAVSSPTRRAGGRTDPEGSSWPASKGDQMTKAGGQPASAIRRPQSGTPAAAGGTGGGFEMGDMGGGGVVHFPQEIGTPKQPNYMTFRCHKITSAVGGTMSDMNFAQTTSAGVQQVALPIPTGVNTTYAQGWDQADVNATQGSLMRAAGNAFGSGLQSPTGTFGGEGDVNQSGTQSIMAAAREGAQGAAATARAGGSIAAITSKIAQSGIGGNAVAGVTLGMAGKVLGGASSTALGVAAFDQTMAFYQGPKFREFNFSYQMIPHDMADTNNIRKIVDFFKTASAPEQISSGLFRIYELPFVFSINFYGINGEMTHMNKIAKCALTSVALTYGGDRFNTFAGTDAPVQTNMALVFKEIQLVTKTDMVDGY